MNRQFDKLWVLRLQWCKGSDRWSSKTRLVHSIIHRTCADTLIRVRTWVQTSTSLQKQVPGLWKIFKIIPKKKRKLWLLLVKKKLPNNTHASFSFFFFFLSFFGSFAPLSKWAEKHVQCQDWVLVTEVLKVIAFGQYGKKCAARWQTVLKTHALPHLWQSRFPNGFWELVPVARHYIANSFDLHRDSTRRLIVTSRVSGRKRRVSLCSQAVTGVTSIAAWRPGPRRTKSLVSIFTRFPKQQSSLDVGKLDDWEV